MCSCLWFSDNLEKEQWICSCCNFLLPNIYNLIFYFCTIGFIYLSFLNKTLAFFVSMCVLFLQSSKFLTQTDHQMFKNICINHIKIEISLIGSNYIFQ